MTVLLATKRVVRTRRRIVSGAIYSMRVGVGLVRTKTRQQREERRG